MPSDPWDRPHRSDRPTLASEGERLAAEHLARAGYRIAARNVRADGVELDLVATRGTLVVFVEVKTRSARAFGAPEEAVDARKCARLVRGARAWLHAHAPRHACARFDVICVEPGPDGALRVRHLPAAFDAS
jgi:putative endonuclease